MGGGYVLNFSDRTMEDFFREEFKIAIYDKKYDFDDLSRSKANRLRGIWIKEDNNVVGSIVLALVDHTENNLLLEGKEVGVSEKELIKKAREIGMSLMFSELLNAPPPEVETLKNKARLIKEFSSFDVKILETNKRIYLLKVLYSYYEAILETYYGPGLFFVSSGIDDLNDYFKVLRRKMIELIDSDATFLDVKNSNGYERAINQITSLYSSAEFLDVVWDSMHPAMISLREDLADKDLFENGLEVHKTNIVVSQFLEAISKEIEVLKKYLQQKTKNFYKNELPESKENMGDFFGTAKKEDVIKHEHKHFFENSIQEKDVNLNIKNRKESIIKISLAEKIIIFDETKPAILINEKVCPLPPAKNEDYFAKAMFRRPVGEFVDWSIIHQEITGKSESIGDKTDQRMVRDTMDRLNNRIQELLNTDDELFSWENKSIKRNY